MLRTIVAITLLVLTPSMGWANMANPYVEGDAPGEIHGAAVSTLRVEREELTFDMRPLAEHEGAIVEAVYHVVNEHQARRLPLQFVAPRAHTEGVTVTLDGARVDAHVVENAPVPAAWSATAARADSGATEKSFLFEVDLPRGSSEIRVRYAAEAWTNSHFDGVELETWGLQNAYTLPYVLAPIRDWGGFGALEVEVLWPEGWSLSTSLDGLSADSGGRATFNGVPADVIHVGVAPPTTWITLESLALAILCLLFALALPAAIGHRAASSSTRAAAAQAVASLALGLLVMGCSLFLTDAIAGALGVNGHLRTEYVYSRTLPLLLCSPVLALVALASWYVARRRARA